MFVGIFITNLIKKKQQFFKSSKMLCILQLCNSPIICLISFRLVSYFITTVAAWLSFLDLGLIIISMDLQEVQELLKNVLKNQRREQMWSISYFLPFLIRLTIFIRYMRNQLLNRFCYNLALQIFIRIKMMEQYQSQLQKVAEKFHKQKHRLPKDIAWKLQYMLDFIHKTAKPMAQLTQQQRNQVKDLEDMTPNALVYAFTTIVNSILTPNLYCSFQKNCKIKLQGLMPRWVSVYSSFEDHQILFTNRKRVFTFAIEDLQCFKISERQFQFKYRGVRKSKIKFDHPDAARNMIAKINKLLEQHNKNKKKETGEQEILNQKHYQHVLSHEYTVSYKKNENIFMTHKTEPKIHVSLFLKGQFWDIFHLMEFLITQKFWNSRVAEEKFSIHSENKLLIERRLQSSSFFSLERRTLTQIIIKKVGQNSYVLEQKNFPSAKTSKSIIVSDIHFKIIFDILSPKIVKITLDCLFNAKGYCNRSSSRSMLVDLYHDIIYLEEKYRKLKAKNSLHFKLNLSKYCVEDKVDIPMIENQIIQNNQLEEEAYYSIATNRHYLDQQLEGGEVKDEFQDTINFYDDESQSGSNQDVGDKSPQKESKNQTNQNHLKQKCIQNNMIIQTEEKGDTLETARKNDQYQKLRPHNYDDKISVAYLKLVKQKVYEKSYLKMKFNQKVLSKFLSNVPWYDPSVMIPNGKEYEVSKSNQLVFINYDLIKGQKDSLIFVIKQVGANLISGKSVLNVSLPVDIFQPRSLLERSTASFGCAPKYLKPVANADVYTQMKAVIGFMLSVSPLELIMLKPFNPILGETFQAYLGGVPICYEQISHHPPISSYYMTCDEFTLYGNLIAVANVSLNSGSGGNGGKMNIVMKNGNAFEVSFFPGQISGLIYGKRKYSICHKSFVIQRGHKLVAEVSANKQSKGLYEWKSIEKQPTNGDLIGGIFKVKEKFFVQNPVEKSMMYHPGLKKSEVQQRKDLISGLWFSQIYIGKQLVNSDKTAYPVEYSRELLPSDANFRMDILMHRLNDLARSQTQKELLQGIQRKDRKLRQNKQKVKTQ